MTCLEKYLKEHPERTPDWVIRNLCPHVSGGFDIPAPEACDTGGGDTCTRCWNRIFLPVMAEEPTPTIKDSGDRHQFESGAVRDMQEGKGRCDLMPLDVVARVMGGIGDGTVSDTILDDIALFQQTGDVKHLYYAFKIFTQIRCGCLPTMLLETAIHFENGAKKYGEVNGKANWQNGIPLNSYINSAVRHYLKYQRGDQDEPHDRAFCWNILCAIWTCKHHPDLNPYGRKKCVVCGADIPANEDACPKCKVYARPPENTCVCCGAPIPEGRQVCPTCEELPGQMNMFDRKENNHAED